MFLFKLHLFLSLYGLIFKLDVLACPKGKRTVIIGRKEHCEDCQDGFFLAEESHTQHCLPCRKCDEDSGSVISKPCNKTSNTKCECRKGFVASDEDFSTCRCNAGFGKSSRECKECEPGFFSKSINSPCKKWKECKFGVKINGTKTSDVICNEIPQIYTSVATSPTPVRVVSSDRPDQPGEHTQTQRLLTTSATKSSTRQITHPDTTVQPSFPSSTADTFGFLITFATVGLLMLTIMIIKFYFAFYKEKHESVQKRESLCKRPVEEIGGGSQVSLKLDPEEY